MCRRGARGERAAKETDRERGRKRGEERRGSAESAIERERGALRGRLGRRESRIAGSLRFLLFLKKRERNKENRRTRIKSR